MAKFFESGQTKYNKTQMLGGLLLVILGTIVLWVAFFASWSNSGFSPPFAPVIMTLISIYACVRYKRADK